MNAAIEDFVGGKNDSSDSDEEPDKHVLVRYEPSEKGKGKLKSGAGNGVSSQVARASRLAAEEQTRWNQGMAAGGEVDGTVEDKEPSEEVNVVDDPTIQPETAIEPPTLPAVQGASSTFSTQPNPVPTSAVVQSELRPNGTPYTTQENIAVLSAFAKFDQPYAHQPEIEADLHDQGFERNFNGIGKQYHKLDGACLLYTSPSPRDGLLSRMPSSA